LLGSCRYERPRDAEEGDPARQFSTEYAGRVQHMKDTWYTTLNVDYSHLLDVSPWFACCAAAAAPAQRLFARPHPGHTRARLFSLIRRWRRKSRPSTTGALAAALCVQSTTLCESTSSRCCLRHAAMSLSCGMPSRATSSRPTLSFTTPRRRGAWLRTVPRNSGCPSTTSHKWKSEARPLHIVRQLGCAAAR
jgi:hypothetical protein